LFQKFAEVISYILNGFFTAFFVFTGVFLNVICVIIHAKYNRRNTPIIHYYLIALTGWQTALLINAFFLYSFPTLMLGRIEQGGYAYVYPIAYTLANATHTATVWIVLMLTIDRYFALCRPLTHHVGGGRSRTKWLVILSSIFAVVFCMPRYFEICVVTACESDGTNCFPMIIQTNFSSNPTYFKIYRIALVTLTVTVLPCVLIFIFTLTISCELRRAYLRRKSLCPKTSDQAVRTRKLEMRKDRKANIMLVLVIAKFLLSDVLPTVADVVELVMGSEVFNVSSTATILVAISNFLLVVNCSTNFWVFLLWGKHFRDMFKELMVTVISCAKLSPFSKRSVSLLELISLRCSSSVFYCF
uniref:G_PROTEIN_RECEP_F1_2 domain-containing protein n=1 Tax=Syphacia muris TaxID=451379 RepID=A0A0N5ANR9_9BILA